MSEPRDQPDPTPAAVVPSGTCPRCEGSGRYQNLPGQPDRPCAVCDGTGQFPPAPVPDAAMALRTMLEACDVHPGLVPDTAPAPAWLNFGRMRELDALIRRLTADLTAAREECERLKMEIIGLHKARELDATLHERQAEIGDELKQRSRTAEARVVELEQENAALRAQIAAHCERIAAQSELLGRRSEGQT